MCAMGEEYVSGGGDDPRRIKTKMWAGGTGTDNAVGRLRCIFPLGDDFGPSRSVYWNGMLMSLYYGIAYSRTKSFAGRKSINRGPVLVFSWY